MFSILPLHLVVAAFVKLKLPKAPCILTTLVLVTASLPVYFPAIGPSPETLCTQPSSHVKSGVDGWAICLCMFV